MKTILAFEHRSAALTRFGLISCLMIALTCASPTGIAFARRPGKAQEDDNEIDTIGVNTNASGPLLDLLANDFSIVKINAPTAPFNLVPVIVGPAVLNNQQIMAYVISVYNAGLTVAIVNATQDQANRFEALVEGEQAASCVPVDGQSVIALYGLQQSLSSQPGQDARYCLPELTSTRRAARVEENWLRARFGATPPSSSQGTDIAVSDSINLDSLSRKIHCSGLTSNQYGQIQQDFFLTKVRSFDLQRDYYYVNDYVQFRPEISNYSNFSVYINRPFLTGDSTDSLDGTRLTFTEPETTVEYVSQYTNSRSFTFGGSVGFTGKKPDVKVNGSYTIGKSETTTIPPVTILNTSDLLRAIPSWRVSPANPHSQVVYNVVAGFLWYIDKNIYDKAGDNVTELSDFFSAGIQPNFLVSSARCEFPPPFPTFDVGAPIVTGVEPTSAQRGGGSFLIHGSQMYPGIVSNVLLGGDALPTSNYIPLDDGEIRVVVPSNQKKGPTPVQVNTSFNGSTLFSNNNIMINIK